MKRFPRFPRFPGNKALAASALYLAAIFGCVELDERAQAAGAAPEPMSIRTTAYTHTEADHTVYGRKTAIGTTLKAGEVNSAAADWSVFPLGTKFRIVGEDTLYEVEDYGSALVGTETIDIYRPSRTAMNQWGVRNVDIEIVEEGCVEKSIAILEGRTAYRHCREMLERLRAKA